MHYRAILSGQRRDPLAFFLRIILRGMTLPYLVVVVIRNLAFDRGWMTVHHSDVPVISIGNLTTGGTGKTPLVCYLARRLRDCGLRVALVSRGYGAAAGEENDEAMELAWSLPDVPHLQNPDRVESARVAVEELETEVIVMDDGFQHRRLGRDFDIVVIDATCPFGYDALLPRGLLREPLRGLRRADVVVFTRCDAVTPEQFAAIRARVARFAPQAIVTESVHRPAGLLSWPNRSAPIDRLADQSVAVLCGIGNPAAFVRTVESCGLRIVDTLTLPDHDRYEPSTLEMIRLRLGRLGDSVSAVVCTHKDLVKLQTDRLGGLQLWALRIEIDLISGKTEFDREVTRVASPGESPSA